MHTRFAPLALVAVAASCKPVDVKSDYALQLHPAIPINQDTLFDGSPDVSVIVHDSRGFSEPIAIGNVQAGFIEGLNMPPLANAWVGVLVEDGGKRDEVDWDRLIAYGEVGPFDLAVGEVAAEADFLLHEFAGMGDLGTLDDKYLAATPVLTSSGRVFLFGGTKNHASLGKYDVLWMDTDAASWTFARAEDSDEGNVGINAARMTAGDGTELILVGGGRPRHNTWGPNSPGYRLFDPDTRKFVSSKVNALVASSSAATVVMDNGTALIVGGFSGDGTSMPFDVNVFDVARVTGSGPYNIAFEPGTGDALGVRAFGLAGTSMGASGAVFCGGTFFTVGDQSTMSPTDACDAVSLTGEARGFTRLPAPRFDHAMTTLSDGRVLLTGGVEQSLPGESEGTALATAWILDPTGSKTWEPVGNMVSARAMHALAPTANGGAIALGGATLGGFDPPVPGAGDRVRCPEIWDPETGEWSEWGTCSDVGTGTFSTFSYHPNHGVFALTGYDAFLTGGDTFGMVGTGPAL